MIKLRKVSEHGQYDSAIDRHNAHAQELLKKRADDNLDNMLWSKPDRDTIYDNTFHSQMDSEDVEKDRIKLENVKPPGMKMPVKEDPKPE